MDKVICVGKNYLKHALELGDAVPEDAIIFLKPPSCVVQVPAQATAPVEVTWPKAGEVHHELELVLKLGKKDGAWIFSEYTFGLDMTLRDMQSRLKKAGQPWERAKVFPNAAVVGPWRRLTDLNQLLQSEFTLKINGKVVQLGVGRNMRFPPLHVLEDVKSWLDLREGDIVFTGTPEGVGPVNSGDLLEISGPDIHYQVKCRLI